LTSLEQCLRSTTGFGISMGILREALTSGVDVGMQRHAVFLVIGTFVYSIITLPYSPNLIEGVFFLIFGVFLIPLIVGLPLKLLASGIYYLTKWRFIASTMDTIALILVITLTQQAYVYIFMGTP